MLIFRKLLSVLAAPVIPENSVRQRLTTAL